MILTVMIAKTLIISSPMGSASIKDPNGTSCESPAKRYLYAISPVLGFTSVTIRRALIISTAIITRIRISDAVKTVDIILHVADLCGFDTTTTSLH